MPNCGLSNAFSYNQTFRKVNSGSFQPSDNFNVSEGEFAEALSGVNLIFGGLDKVDKKISQGSLFEIMGGSPENKFQLQSKNNYAFNELFVCKKPKATSSQGAMDSFINTVNKFMSVFHEEKSKKLNNESLAERDKPEAQNSLFSSNQLPENPADKNLPVFSSKKPVNNSINKGQEDFIPVGKVKADKVYANHLNNFMKAQFSLSESQKSELQAFQTHFFNYCERYESIAEKTGIPSKLIAALHWKESQGDFRTNLKSVGNSGKNTTKDSANAGLFKSWEDSTISVLSKTDEVKERYCLNHNSEDIAAMLGYADHYNGLTNQQRGTVSPFVYEGTTLTDNGQNTDYMRDANTYNNSIGIFAMLVAV